MASADSVATVAAQNFAAASQRADAAVAAAQSALSQASAAANGLTVTAPQAVYPSYVSATAQQLPGKPTDFSTDVANAFNYAFGTFNAALQPQILNYLTAFFPDIAAAVKTGSDQWIIDTLTLGRSVPIAVENALWQRARDKEVIEAARLEKEIIEASASRGFVAPPGVLNFTVAATTEELNKKLQGINRDIAIKAFDTLNENAKFAIQQAVSLRSSFVAALGDFIKTAMIQPNNAVEYSKAILAAKSTLYDSAIKLYSAQIDEERVGASVALGNQSAAMQAALANVQGFGHATDAKIQAATVQGNVAVAAAQALAEMAGRAIGSQNSMTSISAGV